MRTDTRTYVASEWREPLEEYMIQLRPVPKSNPFFGKGRAITLSKDREYRRAVVQELRDQRGNEERLSKPVEIVAYFGYKRPKRSKLPHPRPDLDNLSKALLDAIKQVCIVDDSQVSRLTLEKGWESEDVIIIQLFDRLDQSA